MVTGRPEATRRIQRRGEGALAPPKPRAPRRGEGAALVDPVRFRILGLLRQPRSAADVARALGTSRQRVAYHVRALRRDRLVETALTRRKGNCVERLLRVTARVHTIAPDLVAALGVDPETVQDRLSSAYLGAVAARMTHEVTTLERRARDAGKKLPTLTLHSTRAVCERVRPARVRRGTDSGSHTTRRALQQRSGRGRPRVHRRDRGISLPARRGDGS